MRPSLPVEGISSLILGNDLAGERVMVDPRVVEKPRDDEKMERLRRKLVSQVHFLKTLQVSLSRGVKKRRRKPW